MEWIMDKDRPICPQIEEQISAQIASGAFCPDEKLKSVREIAVEAGVNPNTVQKAFSNLERDGLIYSRVGSGWYVGNARELAEKKVERVAREKVSRFVADMTLLGKTKKEILYYLQEENNE